MTQISRRATWRLRRIIARRNCVVFDFNDEQIGYVQPKAFCSRWVARSSPPKARWPLTCCPKMCAAGFAYATVLF